VFSWNAGVAGLWPKRSSVLLAHIDGRKSAARGRLIGVAHSHEERGMVHVVSRNHLEEGGVGGWSEVRKQRMEQKKEDTWQWKEELRG